MIVLIDNYDSFVHNLARYFQRLGQKTVVVRNDCATAEEVSARAEAIVLSPGPCTPNEAGISVEVVRRLGERIPILGVCLGHQVIGASLGAQIVPSAEPRHGRTSLIDHNAMGLFAGLPSPISVCRYHSLIIEQTTLPNDLRVTARTPEGVIMAIEHRKFPVYGVQFHPEAALTEHGYAMLANFVRLAGLTTTADSAALAVAEFRTPMTAPFMPPPQPVTF